jgi:hypothetical protein
VSAADLTPASRGKLPAAITRHADTRLQQRGLPRAVIEWLQQFGAEEHDKHGAVIRYFDKAARRRLERALGRAVVRRMSGFLDAYLVENGGSVVTIGHRTQRLRRH